MENDELVLCIYNENEVSINQKIIEIFKEYLLSSMQNDISK